MDQATLIRMQCKTFTANTISIRPSIPVTFSMIENLTRRITNHTANASPEPSQ